MGEGVCHVQQTKEYDSDGSHTEQMSALNSAESQRECVCRVIEDNGGDNVKDFWWFVDSETHPGQGENGTL